MSLGKTIRAARETQGRSLTLFAIEVGISKGHLSAIETGKKDPSLLTLRCIASELSISAGSLLDPGLYERGYLLGSKAAKSDIRKALGL